VVGAAVAAFVGAAVGVSVAVGLPHPASNPTRVNTNRSLHTKGTIFIAISFIEQVRIGGNFTRPVL
jgi:hypothetical protein